MYKNAILSVRTNVRFNFLKTNLCTNIKLGTIYHHFEVRFIKVFVMSYSKIILLEIAFLERGKSFRLQTKTSSRFIALQKISSFWDLRSRYSQRFFARFVLFFFFGHF